MPYAVLSPDINRPPVFGDHHLFIGLTNGGYELPEQASGFGILSTFTGSGNYFINGQKIPGDTHSFAVVNHGSRLAIEFSKAAAQPAFLFFHTKLARLVSESLQLSTEELLDGHEIDPGIDLAYLERVHVKTQWFNDALRLLPLLGDSCSSFHALKADCIVRNILEQLLVQNNNEGKLAANLSVVKRSTRIELFRRLALAKEWIDQYYCNPITLDQMAKVAALNSQHFLRMFRRCYGITPHQYLINLRLEQSKNMLTGSGEPVAVICASVGFESLSSFSWLFKKRFGLSPTQFRNAG